MSVRNETYLIVGIKLDRDKVSQLDGFLDFPWCGENAKGLKGILTSCYDDSYCIAGYCVEVAKEDDCGFPLMEINTRELIRSYQSDVFDWIASNALLPMVISEDESIKVYLLTHYH